MSEDLLARLLEKAVLVDGSALHNLLREAASEIMRLRLVVSERDREVVRLKLSLGESSHHIGALRLSEPVKPSEDWERGEEEYEKLYDEDFHK